MQDQDDHSWLKQGSTSTVEVAKSYDDWAKTYDETLADWDYRAPAQAAGMLRAKVGARSTILDLGCGTGLTGAALRAAGFTGPIDGKDLSPLSLEQAGKSGIYRSLEQADLQALPLSPPDDSYDAVICIGVLTYVPDSEAVLREFARMARPGGTVLVSQRDDLFRERAFGETVKALAKAGVFNDVAITDPQPYLPGNPDFGTEMKVLYVTMTVS